MFSVLSLSSILKDMLLYTSQKLHPLGYGSGWGRNICLNRPDVPVGPESPLPKWSLRSKSRFSYKRPRVWGFKLKPYSTPCPSPSKRLPSRRRRRQGELKLLPWSSLTVLRLARGLLHPDPSPPPDLPWNLVMPSLSSILSSLMLVEI